MFPSAAVLKTGKAAEVIMKIRVLWQEKTIKIKKNINLKIQYAVLKQLDTGVFNQSADYSWHTFGVECGHLTSLLIL